MADTLSLRERIAQEIYDSCFLSKAMIRKITDAILLVVEQEIQQEQQKTRIALIMFEKSAAEVAEKDAQIADLQAAVDSMKNAQAAAVPFAERERRARLRETPAPPVEKG